MLLSQLNSRLNNQSNKVICHYLIAFDKNNGHQLIKKTKSQIASKIDLPQAIKTSSILYKQSIHP